MTKVRGFPAEILMKFMHLADLHIGKVVNGFSMLEEQRHIFDQVVAYVASERPDAVLIAGDVYDRAIPSGEAVLLFDDFLTRLAEKEVAVLLVSGNHDSSERLHYASRLLSERRVHLCGMFDGTLQSVRLNDAYGSVDCWLLPFIRPVSIRDALEYEGNSYTDAVRAALKTADIDFSRRNVLLSHQFYANEGVEPERSESEMNRVGGLDAVDTAVLSPFDYVALGHLHKGQNVGANARYAGSPLKYSFSEWKHEKSVTMVTLREKGNLEIATLPLTPLHDMREMRGSFEQLCSREWVAQGDCQDYLRLILTDEEEIIDAMIRLRHIYPNIMILDVDNARAERKSYQSTIGVEQLERLSTYDLFSEFFLRHSGAVMSDMQAEIVRELLEGGDEDETA